MTEKSELLEKTESSKSSSLEKTESSKSSSLEPVTQSQVEFPELVSQGSDVETKKEGNEAQSIEEPAKVMRLGAMMRQLLEQVKDIELDEPARDRIRDIYEQSITELGSALSPDLHDELLRLSGPFSSNETPSEAELAVAKAQLVGWLEGLVQGIQATLVAQQLQAKQQLAVMRNGLPAPSSASGQSGASAQNDPPPGRYL